MKLHAYRMRWRKDAADVVRLIVIAHDKREAARGVLSYYQDGRTLYELLPSRVRGGDAIAAKYDKPGFVTDPADLAALEGAE